MMFKRLSGYLFVALISLSLLAGCGKGDKEAAKELLTRILQIVGIPYDIVINICQDGNNNGLCELTELQTKVTIKKGDSFETILNKVELTEDGKYFLENYDPTKKILMEIEDNEHLNNSGQQVTLEYEPKEIEEVPVQELSILQALIDKGLLKEEEVKKLRESNVRPKVDAVLLENLFENQTILVEQNMSTVDAKDRNLEYIAEGLRDINVSGNLVENLETCENNSSCEETILVDANEQTQINKEEAVVIAENNSTEGTGDKDTSLTHEENNTTSEESNTTTQESNTTTQESNTTTTSTENQAPVANAGADKTVNEGDTVNFDASGSTGDITSYVWREAGTILSEASSFTKDNLSVGTHTITLEVTEGDGDKDTDSITITVTAIEKTSKNVADGYIVKLSSPAVAVCNDGHQYNSSMSIGEKGRIIFPDTNLTSDCNITVASGAIIDSNNNGIYDAGTDKEILFDMKAPGDATFISPLTTLLLAKEAKGEDVTDLKLLVKDFDPVTAVTTIKNGTDSEAEKSKKLMSLMEVLKVTLENNASIDILNDINISTLSENNSSDFNITLFTQNLPTLFREKANRKAMIMQNLIDLSPSIDSNIIDLETFTVAISDGGKSIEDAFKASVRDSVSSSVRADIVNAVDLNATLRGVLKNSYSSENRDIIFNYFSMLSNNIHKFAQGYFNFNLLGIDTSVLITRTLEIENIADLDGIYKVTTLDMIDDSYYNIDYKNYNPHYQKNDIYEVDNGFYIKTNAVSKFEIIDGLDSNLFRISQGNRQIAYMDLKEGLSSPTIDNYEDVNHDGVYEVEVKITDVQMLESQRIVLKFAIVDEKDKTIFANPITTKTGYISKHAVVGGLVLNRSNYSSLGDPQGDAIITVDNIEIDSMRLEGVGSDDFEIIDNQKIKVAKLLDYDTKSIYNLEVIATDNYGKEYNATLTINVTNDTDRTMQFQNQELLEKLSTRSQLNRYYNFIDSLYLVNGNPATFKIEEGLDAKFFYTYLSNYSYINDSVYLENNSSFNPSYLSAEDANGDGIYEVNITATDVQTLESTSMVLKYRLVSSTFTIYNYYDSDKIGRESQTSFNVNEETVVGGEVSSALIRIDKADDVNITDMHIEGEGNEDFNITNNAITIANTLNASNKNSYTLKVVSTDSTGYVNEQNITINVNYSGGTHEAFTITNRDDLKVNLFTVNWYDWYSSENIHTNNVARMSVIGDDVNMVVNMEKFYQYYDRHSTYFQWNRAYLDNEDRPTYLNPKDKNGDNIYEAQIELRDIQTLETETIDYRLEMLSHQVQPYWASYYNGDYQTSYLFRYSNNLEVNLSIPQEAPIGGELLEQDGAKGFYLSLGEDISFNSASLEGVGAEKFEIVEGNRILLKEQVTEGDEYNLTLVISDSESEESQNPLYIHVGTIH